MAFMQILMWLFFLTVDGQVPRPCPCNYCADNKANCANAKYSSVPPGLFPEDITVINMQINFIRRIKKDDFGELKHLVLLRLDSNNITDLDQGAFAKMPKLNELVLEFNELKSLPDDLVHPDAPFRKGIKLKGNKLTYFPLLLLKRTESFINVMDNPINCDCYSIIPDHLKSKVIGVCSSPAHLKGKKIASITPKDVGCDVCQGVRCNKGACYSFNNKNPVCTCYMGYIGPNCNSETSLRTTTSTSTPSTTISTTSTTTSTPSTTISTTSTTTSTTSTTSSTTSTTSSTTSTTPLTTTTESSTTTEQTTEKPTTQATTTTTTSTTTTTPATSTRQTTTSTTDQTTTTTKPTTVAKTTTAATTTTTKAATTQRTTTTSKPTSTTEITSTETTTKKINDTCSNLENCGAVVDQITGEYTITSAEQYHKIARRIQKDVKSSDGSAKDKIKVYPKAVSLINILLEADDLLVAQAQKRYQSPKIVLDAIKMMFKKIGDSLSRDTNKYSISKKNVAVSVWLSPEEENDLYIIAGKTKNSSVTASSNKPYLQMTKPQSKTLTLQSVMHVPSNVLKTRPNTYISSVNYQNNGFFLSTGEVEDILELGDQSNATVKKIVHSNVFAVSIGDKSIKDLRNPVKIYFHNMSSSVRDGDTCKFWKFQTSELSHGAWSNEGCRKIYTNTSDTVSCECDHLTNFALILNSEQEYYNPLALQIVTFVGCGISITSLFVTLLVYIFFSKINRKLAPKLLICLSSSLLILLIIFVVGAEQTENYHACQLIAILIHYFILSSFCWMACEAFNLYRNFINIFKRTRNEHSILVRMSIFSWGIPLFIVAVTMTTALEEYGSPDVCVVHGTSFYYGLLLPVCMILFGNWIVLFLSLKGMQRSKILRKSRRKREKENTQWLNFIRAAVCATILGLTWTFAILAVGYMKTVFQWLFCIFNSLQGFAIFLLFVVNNKEAKHEIYIWIKGKSRRGDNESSSIGKASSGNTIPSLNDVV